MLHTLINELVYFFSSVAAQLYKGSSVAPEKFENVTIGFTDIVGFQNIVLNLMPFQVNY